MAAPSKAPATPSKRIQRSSRRIAAARKEKPASKRRAGRNPSRIRLGLTVNWGNRLLLASSAPTRSSRNGHGQRRTAFTRAGAPAGPHVGARQRKQPLQLGTGVTYQAADRPVLPGARVVLDRAHVEPDELGHRIDHLARETKTSQSLLRHLGPYQLMIDEGHLAIL